MKNPRYLAVLLMALALPALAGCGSNNREAEAASSVAFKESAACIGCHADNKISPVTGRKIVAEWQAGAHNTGSGAACADCHEPNGHPNGGSVTRTPDNAVCLECHKQSDPKLKAHFVNYTTAYTGGAPDEKTSLGTPGASKYATASYVSGEDGKKQCVVCHNPHDNSSLLQVNRDWAKSGHADTEALPFVKYRFKEVAFGALNECRRCHTSTGFVYYVGNNNTIMPTADFKNSKRNDVIGCKTCHVDYSWKRRALGAVTATYVGGVAGSTPDVVAYPDAGESNICLNCHVGRESGNAIKGLPSTVNFANKGFENSHYLTAGGTLFAESGYEFAGRDYTSAKTVAHRNIGISAGRSGKGPCVDCHMSNSGNHKFQPVAKDENGKVTSIVSTVCATCHTGAYALSADFINGEKESFKAALDILKAKLADRNFFFREKNTYFYKTADSLAATNYVTNWVSAGDASANGRATGEPNMGAAFNYNLLKHDPGAFAHNTKYTRQLIYDSIDWIDDNTLNDSVAATIDALATAGKLGGDAQGKAKAYLSSRQ